MKKDEILKTDLYCITSQKHSQGRSNIEVVKEMIASGIKVIQYREKKQKMIYKYKECKIIRKMTKKAGVALIVNDEPCLALAVQAEGVHIGQEDLPLKEVRKIVGNKMLIGLSTHSPKQAIEAKKIGADYIGVGPLFPTETKEDVCSATGLEYLDYIVKNIDIPFVAIGGIKERNIHLVKERGAQTICLVTEIVGANNIKKKIRNLREVLV